MDVLLQEGPTSRAALAKKTGLSKQTMSEVIRTLEEHGWVRQKGMVSGKVGRSAVTYEVAEEAGYAIGVDLGATMIRLAIVSISGRIVAETEAATEGRGGEALLDHLRDLITHFVARSGIHVSKILLGAVATPGVINSETRSLSLAPNIGDVASLDVISNLEAALGCPVTIENDINAAVLGESWLGGTAGLSSSAFIALGTGVGLGMLIEGKVIKGAKGAAGEVAYLPFGPDLYSSASLEKGALETILGAPGLMSAYNKKAEKPLAAGREVLEAALAGDALAREIMEEAGQMLARLVLSVHAILDPEKIILGGNIGGNALMLELVSKELPRLTNQKITLETTQLGSRATLVGAVAVALNALHNSLFSPKDLPGKMSLPRTGGGEG